MSLAALSTTHDDVLPHAAIQGEIDLSNAAKLGSDLVALVPNSAIALTVDLSGVSYLDSAGVSLLFSLGSRLRERGQQLRLIVPTDSLIRRTLDFAGVSAIAEVGEG